MRKEQIDEEKTFMDYGGNIDFVISILRKQNTGIQWRAGAAIFAGAM
jgi:hypothetical protein